MISVEQLRKNGRAAGYVGKFRDKSKVCSRSGSDPGAAAAWPGLPSRS